MANLLPGVQCGGSQAGQSSTYKLPYLLPQLGMQAGAKLHLKYDHTKTRKGVIARSPSLVIPYVSPPG